MQSHEKFETTAERTCRCVSHGLFRLAEKFSLLLLLLLLVGYSVLGSVILCILESTPTGEDHVAERRKNLSDWMCAAMAFNDCSTVEQSLRNFGEFVKNHTEKDQDWSVSEGIVFAGTVYTTIGYGNLSPKTHGGKIFTMVYALFGIPLMFILLSRIGESLCRVIHRVWTRLRGLCCGYVILDQKVFEDIAVEEFDFPVWIALSITLGWMLACSALFNYMEADWDFMTAFYFCFVSLSTIGLGDVVPSDPNTFIMLFILVIVGMALVSMCINLIQVKLEAFLLSLLANIQESRDVIASSEEEAAATIRSSSVVSMNATELERTLANQQVEKLIEEQPNGRWLKRLLSRHQKRELQKEYKKKLRQRAKAVQTEMSRSHASTYAFVETQNRGTQTGTHVIDTSLPIDSSPAPAKEVHLRHVRRGENTDECRGLLKEIDFIISDCRDLVNMPRDAPIPGSRSHDDILKGVGVEASQ